MNKDKEFEMKLLKRYITHYKLAKRRKDKSEILSRYRELTNISRDAAKKRFQRFKEGSVTANNSISRRGRNKKYKQMHELVAR